ncbi:MAG: radical SAM protein [Gemmatimonadales bacterium]|jgi:hypothetical protein
MPVRRDELYRLPWSKVDNAGGWVEVTDACDLWCPGCYRHRLSGHRSLAEVKEEILTISRLTNCDRIAIAGGEPLLYPHIVEVVESIAQQRLKPVLLTNGVRLTLDLARDLREAGLAKYHFHVDSGMRRPDWTGKNEAELNELRQHFADLVWEVGGVQCGFNITVFRSTLQYLPDILDWCRRNIHKVQHVSLIAFRAIPLTERLGYQVRGEPVDLRSLQHTSEDTSEIDMSTDEMFAVLERHDASFRPSAYLSGTSAPETYKFLVTLQVGSAAGFYGYLGARTAECVQVAHHMFTGRYCAFLRNPKVGRKLFIMSMVDRSVRDTARRFLKSVLGNPLRLFDSLYVQSVSLQQPNEIVDGRANLCDGCLNMMMYGDRLIPSCRLDEYRLFGDAMDPVLQASGRTKSYA